MTQEEIAPHVEVLRGRHAELERRLSDPELFSRPKEMRDVSREHQKLSNLFKRHDRWRAALRELEENRVLAVEEEDEEIRQLAAADIAGLEAEVKELETLVRLALSPPDPNDGRDAIVDIRPAAGGEEAALFAGDLLRAYTRYAEAKDWKLETLDFNGSSLGGVKEAIFSISGEDVFSCMKFESGVHRVQRIPTTESGGRIHTSTVTVSVLPEAEEVELEIKPEELRFDVFRASGPGGQCVNTTDSAVRVTHLPTGVSVASQQEKSQHRNKATAMRILRAKLLEVEQQREAAKQADSKREQIGTGDRSERIRTYNFPQNRVTDHRFGVSIHDLPGLLEGKFQNLIDQILAIDTERKLEKTLRGG